MVGRPFKGLLARVYYIAATWLGQMTNHWPCQEKIILAFYLRAQQRERQREREKVREKEKEREQEKTRRRDKKHSRKNVSTKNINNQGLRLI